MTSDLWGEGGLQCRTEMKIVDLSTYPLMPAPSQDGTPTVRALSTPEAGRWMRLLLGKPQSEDVTVKLSSHSFKATCLSMLAKRGCSFEDRLALGYHTGGLRMALTYSRDGASRPLAILCSVLREVRHGVYRPDETRSGRLVSELDVTDKVDLSKQRVIEVALKETEPRSRSLKLLRFLSFLLKAEKRLIMSLQTVRVTVNPRRW